MMEDKQLLLIMTNEEVEEITAVMNTFKYLYPNAHRICPKCNKYILIDGYVCFGCGYDKSNEQNT